VFESRIKLLLQILKLFKTQGIKIFSHEMPVKINKKVKYLVYGSFIILYMFINVCIEVCTSDFFVKPQP